MAEPLLKVYLGKNTKKLLEDAARLSPDLARQLNQTGNNVVRRVADLALKSYKSAVPIDTLELRGQGLDDGYIRRQYNATTVTIYVTSDIHLGRDRKPIDAARLANILNIGISEKNGSVLGRSKNSAAIDGFTSRNKGEGTAGWIKDAEEEFFEKLPQLLERDFVR